MNGNFSRKISKITGPEHVQTAREDLICYSFDGTVETMLPDLVVHPGSRDEVVSIINTAREAKIPVIPRGAGTGLSGGSLARHGGLVLHFDRMSRIIRVDSDNQLAVVEPGVINWELKQAALEAGLFYPPDPGSARFCTLGGNVAENAGGAYAGRYGVTGDYVLGIEAVLASGEVVRAGSEARRDVSGYDIVRLVVGSEGTLAIVTEITLRLIPRPPARRTAFIAFDSFARAAGAVQEMVASGALLAALEILDRTTLECLEQYQPGIMPAAGAMVLMEVDGAPGCVAEQFEILMGIASAAGGSVVRVADDDAGSEQLWDIRRAVSPALGRMATTKIGEDVCVPPGRIAAVYERIESIRREYDLRIAVFGHAGDGNLHPNFLTDRRDEELMLRTREAIGKLFRSVTELGGTLSGEHGIGTEKAPYMSLMRNPPTLALMRRIKEAFDPGNILNPGKILPDDGRR